MIEIQEEYRPIQGSDGRYMVSNKGNVISVYARRNVNNHPSESFMPRMMRPNNNGHGYMYIDMRINNGRMRKYIHRAVAEAFLESLSGKEHVNHIDYNTKNNNVENLEWCTPKENLEHSRQHLAVRHNRRPSEKTNERYICMDKKGRYRVCIRPSYDRRFRTMEQAIEYRNKVLHEIGYSI